MVFTTASCQGSRSGCGWGEGQIAKTCTSTKVSESGQAAICRSGADPGCRAFLNPEPQSDQRRPLIHQDFGSIRPRFAFPIQPLTDKAPKYVLGHATSVQKGRKHQTNNHGPTTIQRILPNMQEKTGEMRYVSPFRRVKGSLPDVTPPRRCGVLTKTRSDKEVPECRRCLASGHKCGGYDLPLRMHVMGIQWERDGTQRMAPVKVLPAKPSSGLPLTSFRDDLAAAYFFQTFSWAPFWRSHLRSAIASPPASSVPQIRSLNKACFQAIVYTHMGLGHGDAALQIEGRQIYSRALTAMQTILASPFPKAQLAWLGETIIIMGMYEVRFQSQTCDGGRCRLTLPSLPSTG